MTPTPTPRTDGFHEMNGSVHSWDLFARQLERELTAEKQRADEAVEVLAQSISRKMSAQDERDQLKQQLEEALASTSVESIDILRESIKLKQQNVELVEDKKMLDWLADDERHVQVYSGGFQEFVKIYKQSNFPAYGTLRTAIRAAMEGEILRNLLLSQFSNDQKTTHQG